MMASMGGHPGETGRAQHELAVYMGLCGDKPLIGEPVPVDGTVGPNPKLMVPVTDGRTVDVAGIGETPIGEPGWSWGTLGKSGLWLTVPGSKYKTPKLGRSPGTAYRYGPDNINTDCALVARTGDTYFRVLALATLKPWTLANALEFEDVEEQAGVLDADARETCHLCRTWATGDHVEGEQHWAKVKAAGVAEYHRQMAALAESLADPQ